jgi:hypothetical protein
MKKNAAVTQRFFYSIYSRARLNECRRKWFALHALCHRIDVSGLQFLRYLHFQIFALGVFMVSVPIPWLSAGYG